MLHPQHRVHDILRRIEDNKLQPDTMKTCFGVLAIMSREESNKQMIAGTPPNSIFIRFMWYVNDDKSAV